MTKRLRGFSIILTFLCATTNGAAETLQGGVKETAPLQPTVHVIPANASKNQPLDGHALQQYSGNRLQGGASQPSLQSGVNAPGYSAYYGGHAVNQIPPVTTYTLTPHSGVMQFPGRYGIPGAVEPPFGRLDPTTQGGPGAQGAAGATQGTIYGDSYSKSGGVTTSSGYTITRVPVLPGTPTPGGASFSVFARYGETKSGISYAPGFEVKTESTEGKLTYNSPGTQVGILTSRAGVSTYVPGYEVTVSTVGVEKETLGGVWSIPEIQPLHAVAGQLMAKKTIAQIFSPEVHPLVAKAELFPCLIPSTDNITTWKLWYQRVAAAIYRRWQYSDVGPGTATARVTVTRSKDVSCQIIDFEPADGVERNADTETQFRETAMRAVNLVTSAEIPLFPPNSAEQQVRFDVDLRRRTTDVAGFDVASTTQSQLQTEEKVTAEMKNRTR